MKKEEIGLKTRSRLCFESFGRRFCGKGKAITKGKGVNACVEVTGVSVAMKQALECASWQGRISLLGCASVSNCGVDIDRV